MVPQGRRRLVVFVVVVLLLELGARFLELPGGPRPRVPVAFGLDVPAVEVGHDPGSRPVVGDGITVDCRVLGEEVIVRQHVLPPDVDRFALLGLDRRTGILAAVPPDRCRREVGVEFLLDLADFDFVVGLSLLGPGRLDDARAGNLVDPLFEVGRGVLHRRCPCRRVRTRGYTARECRGTSNAGRHEKSAARDASFERSNTISHRRGYEPSVDNGPTDSHRVGIGRTTGDPPERAGRVTGRSRPWQTGPLLGG